MQRGCYLVVDKKFCNVSNLTIRLICSYYQHLLHRIKMQLSFQRLQQDFVVSVDSRIDCAQVTDGLACMYDCRVIFPAK